MDAKDLIAHFAVFETVPVDVQDDVVPVLKMHHDIELYFFPNPRLNNEIYKGQIVHWTYPDGEKEVQVIDIDYADCLSPSWARLVCCKELIHILDPIDHRVMTDDGLTKLIEKIILPMEMAEATDGEKVWNDRLAIFYALAVLFPWATRELLLQPYREKKVTLTEIAQKVDLPEEYVGVVMHESWERAHNLISNI